MALRETVKSSIRRHLRYGNIGVSSGIPGGGSLGANAGWRFFGEWGELEERMDSMQPVDEAALLGTFYSVILFQALSPNAGDTFSLQVTPSANGTPFDINLTANAGETRDSFAGRVATALAQSPGANQARMTILCPSSGGRFNVQNPLSEIQIQCPVSHDVTILSQTGNIGGSVPDNSQQTTVGQVIGGTMTLGFLPVCDQLYSLIGSSSDRMGVDKADVFTARKSEYKERKALYHFAVNSLADFMVSPVNKRATGGNHSNASSL